MVSLETVLTIGGLLATLSIAGATFSNETVSLPIGLQKHVYTTCVKECFFVIVIDRSMSAGSGRLS